MATKSVSKAFSAKLSETRDSFSVSLDVNGLTLATLPGINGLACQRVLTDKASTEPDRLNALISILVALRDAG